MKKNLLKLGLVFNFIGTALLSNNNLLNNQTISNKYLDKESYNNLNLNDSTFGLDFYINDAFNDNSLSLREKKSNKVVIDGEEVETAQETLVSASKYNFNYNGKNYQGEIFASPSESQNTIEKEVNKIKASIYNNTYYQGRALKTNLDSRINFPDKFEIGSSWKMIQDKKYTFIATTSGEHFADYAEWNTVYELQDVPGDYAYYALINESYISPEQKDTDYRTDFLTYQFNPTKGQEAELRDYAPKMKNPEAQISYSVGAGAGINSEGVANFNANISSSYTTLVDSPKVYDHGNMVNNYAEINFDYLYPFQNSKQFYDYNICQSYQSASFIFKAKKDVTHFLVQNNTELGMVRDGIWSNKIVSFAIPKDVEFEK